MQFLFVVLMSVLVGASALPHLLQAPNRPSFSLRKNTNFSLVAIPKFLEKMAELEKKLSSLEEQQKRKLKDLALKESGAPSSEEQLGLDLQEDQLKKLEREISSEEAEESRAFASYVGPPGSMMIENAELKNCICESDKLMSCRLWVEGYCSAVDDYVAVTAKTEESYEFSKNFRCKEENRFSGFMALSGTQTARITIAFRNQLYKKDLSLNNHCGPLGLPSPTEDE